MSSRRTVVPSGSRVSIDQRSRGASVTFCSKVLPLGYTTLMT
ncbi:MAG: hypothetical protein U0235_00995 [Polyangiaceae bacterium]